MACSPSQAMAMSARLPPSTVAHVLRLVGTSYLEAGLAGPSTTAFRALSRPAQLGNSHVRASRRFASSAHALAGEAHYETSIHTSLLSPASVIRTPKKMRYDLPVPSPVPEWAQIPIEVESPLFEKQGNRWCLPSGFRQMFAKHPEATPLTILPPQRLIALFRIFSAEQTSPDDWAWLGKLLQQAKDSMTPERWQQLPESQSLFRMLHGLALAQTGEWHAGGASISMGLKLAVAMAPSEFYFPKSDRMVLEAYMRLLRLHNRPEELAEVVRFAGPKVQKILSQFSSSQQASPPLARLRKGVYDTLNTMADPIGWLTTQLKPGADGRSSRSVYHVAVALLTALVANPARTRDAFVLWRHITQHFNSTFVPASTASVLAVHLARSGDTVAAQDVLTALHESCAILPHSALSRELWIYADQGLRHEAREVWHNIRARYGPTRQDCLTMATAYAASGDIEGATECLVSVLGPESLQSIDGIDVIQRAHVAAGDVKGALDCLNKSFAIHPTVEPAQSLLNLYAKQADVDGALLLFDRLYDEHLHPNLHCYTSLMSAFANVADADSAEQVFEAMIAAGIEPDAIAWGVLLNAHIEAGRWVDAAEHYERIPCSIMRTDISLATTMLKAYVLATTPFEQVLHFFRSMASHNAPAWALVIQSAADHDNLAMARALFDEMDETARLNPLAPPPNVYVFSVLLGAYLRAGDRDSAGAIYDLMIARGVVPHSVTYGIIVTSFANSPGESSFEQAHNFAMSVHSQPTLGDHPGARGTASENVFGPLIAAAGRIGDSDRSQRYYEMVVENGGWSISVATKLMDSLRRSGRSEEALEMWDSIFKAAVTTVQRKPRENGIVAMRTRSNVLCVPLSIITQMLGSTGQHAKLLKVWNDVRTAGFGFDAHNYNHMVVALALCGDIERAYHIVDRVILPRYDEVQERYHRAVRPDPTLRPVTLEYLENHDIPADPEQDGPLGDPETATAEDAAELSFRPPNRRHELIVPPPRRFAGEDDVDNSINLSVLREWRPADMLWTPSPSAIAALEISYRQLEDARARYAWMGLATSDDNEGELDDELSAAGAPADGKNVVCLAEFNNNTVKDWDGQDSKMSPKAMIARLNRKYARVVGLVLLHRRKRAAMKMRERRGQ